MSWPGLLILLAGLYVVVVVLRGIIDFAAWCADEHFSGSRGQRERKRKTSKGLRTPKPLRQNTDNEHAGTAQPITTPAAGVAPARRRLSLFAQLRKRLDLLRGSNRYDHWVGCALAEDDPNLKIEYLSKALKLNPAYLPAWGLKAHILFEMGRFQEARECFDKSLAIQASALAWYRKGLCCHRLGCGEEAAHCFRETMRTAHDDPQLMEDAARMMKLVENKSSGKEEVA
jgi:tetratricopeptide (TPR) repeat protein